MAEVTVERPITLVEYKKGEPDSLERIFVENMTATSDVLAALPIMPASKGKRGFMEITELPSVTNRAFNAPGNESTGKFNLREEDTFIMDEYIHVDRAVIDRLGPGHRAKQERLKTTAIAQNATRMIIHGSNTVDPREPDGLQARCTTLNTNYFVAGSTSGGDALSLAKLDILLRSVNGVTHLIADYSMAAFFDTAARSPSLTNNTVTQTIDSDLGRRVTKFQGVPILWGYEPDDSPSILPFTEPAPTGGQLQTSSIYAVSFRDGRFYGIEQTPLAVKDEGQLQGQPFLSTHIKWDWGLAREHPRSISRLAGITAATIVA